MVVIWLALRKHQTTAEAYSFLVEHGAGEALAAALMPVLAELWAKAWDEGNSAAEDLAGPHGHPVEHTPDFDGEFGRPWLSQIVRNRLEGLARIFAEGGDAEDIQRDVAGYLSSRPDAERIALTEVTRAMSAAAMSHYHAAGVTSVRWITAEDARVCADCDANEAAGPHPLGTPFPSGAMAPPEHPRCRCALVPA